MASKSCLVQAAWHLPQTKAHCTLIFPLIWYVLSSVLKTSIVNIIILEKSKGVLIRANSFLIANLHVPARIFPDGLVWHHLQG
jgi:hypothetical protein